MARPEVEKTPHSAQGTRRQMPPVTGDVEGQLAGLSRAEYPELQIAWQRLFRSRPPRKLGRETLELAVAWKLQERATGGHGSPTKRQLVGLAESLRTSGDIAKVRVVALKRGATLLREWNGETHQVLVLDSGFQWRGGRWTSLSAIAREITGTRWSGPRFFGLDRGPAQGKAAPGAVGVGESGGE